MIRRPVWLQLRLSAPLAAQAARIAEDAEAAAHTREQLASQEGRIAALQQARAPKSQSLGVASLGWVPVLKASMGGPAGQPERALLWEPRRQLQAARRVLR